MCHALALGKPVLATGLLPGVTDRYKDVPMSPTLYWHASNGQPLPPAIFREQTPGALTAAALHT